MEPNDTLPGEETGAPVEQDGNVPAHTHPEYDQALLLIQELETRIAALESGGEETIPPAEELPGEGGTMEEDATMIPPPDENKDDEELMEARKGYMEARKKYGKMLKEKKEQLTGVPEEDRSTKKKVPLGTVTDIPSTKQPPVGDALGEDAADDIEKDAIKALQTKPSPDLPKDKVIKNKTDTGAKPAPGETAPEEPDEMEGSEANKEGFDKVYQETFSKLKEELEEDEKKKDEDDKAFNEKLFTRQSVVDGRVRENLETSDGNKEKVEKTVKEYLGKRGQGNLLS